LGAQSLEEELQKVVDKWAVAAARSVRLPPQFNNRRLLTAGKVLSAGPAK